LISLDDPLWSKLEHAYGSAANIPALLIQLEDVPSSIGDNEPWFSLWSALAHQGDVYSASFAAVPYVINALASAPLSADFTYFQFPAWVEICRQKNNVTVPLNLAPAYFESLSRIPALIAAASEREWDVTFLQCALSALAASNGEVSIAEAALELSPSVAEEFLNWHFEK